MGLQFQIHLGADVAAVIEPLAHLRITVFRDWPYLYDGNMDYERQYLADYARVDGMICTAWDGAQMVGASTAMALSAQPAEVCDAFAGQGVPPVAEVYYCAESVLLAAYRGQGAGHRFFDAREARGRELGFRHSAFCAVMREAGDPRRPDGYRPLDGFWAKRGYAPLPGAVARIAWQDMGDRAETEKPLQFWTRRL